MNCCSKSGIHERSSKSQMHTQIFHRIAWLFPSIFLTMEKRLPCSAMCPAICGDRVPMSLPYSFELPGQLLNWLRVQGVSSKLHYFWQQVLLCGTKFQPQDCLSLLNLLLLDGTGLPGALPSTRQGMHPLISLETLKLRRMNLLQYSSPDVPGLFDAIGLEAEEELDGNPFFFLFLNFRHRNAANQAFLSMFLASLITSFLFLTFVSCHARFFSMFHFFHCCLCTWNFRSLRQRNKFVNQIVML